MEAIGQTAAAAPARKWEEMDLNLLAEIFGHLDLADLLLSIPFVCKPWKRASLLPRCWRILTYKIPFHQLVDRLCQTYRLDIGTFSFSGLLKLVLSRSQGSATHLCLADGDWCYDDEFSDYDLEALSTECPNLKFVYFSWMKGRQQMLQMRKLIGKLKDLEGLSLRGEVELEELLPVVGNNCRNFSCLLLRNMYVYKETVSSMVEHIPGLKQLYLLNLRIDKDDLVRILKGCKHLDVLSIKNCVGFVADEEILQHGGSIRQFTCEGCELSEGEEYGDESLGMRDVYDGNSDDGYEP